jgi:hypothetical protein
LVVMVSLHLIDKVSTHGLLTFSLHWGSSFGVLLATFLMRSQGTMWI